MPAHLRLFVRLRVRLLVLALVLLALPGRATHLLGGEMSYRYLGPAATAGSFRYEVTVLVYVSAGSGSGFPQGRNSVEVGFYSKAAPGNQLRKVTLPRDSFRDATPRVPRCPGVAPAPPVSLAKYVGVVELPASLDGYYAFYTDSARNRGITNITPLTGAGVGVGGESGNMTLYLDMAPPALPNASPIFADTAVALICLGDTSIIVNNAVDPDGDRLSYSFGTPYAGDYGGPGAPVPLLFAPPPPTIPYPAGYSTAQPFGPAAGNLAALDANTGLSRYLARDAGTYVVAVDVEEYRTIGGREVLVGRTRRDVQLITRVCPPAGNTPVLSLTTPRTFTVEEGQLLSFPLVATVRPATIPVAVRVSSVLLDGAGGYAAAYGGQPGAVAAGQPTGIVSLTGAGTAGADFVFTPRCGEARATPYDIVVAATNQDCRGKGAADVFRILVTRPAGPNAVAGDRRVCVPGAAPRTYSAGGPVPTSYRWRVRGGTFVGAATGPAVQVQWGPAGGTGRLVAVGFSALGCPTDSAVVLVELGAAPALSITPAAATVCPGASVTLQVAAAGAPTGQTYTWTDGDQTFSGDRISVSPAVTTTYTVTSVSPGAGACSSTAQVTVAVAPPVPPPGLTLAAPPVRCAGEALTFTPEATNAGPAPTYRWLVNGVLAGTAPSFSSSTLATGDQVRVELTPTAGLCNPTPAAIAAAVTVTRLPDPAPAVTIAVAPTGAVCPGTPLIFRLATVTEAGPAADYTYQWQVDGVDVAGATAPIFTRADLRQGQAVALRLGTRTAACGQPVVAVSAAVAVRINPPATVDAGLDKEVIEGESVELEGTTGGPYPVTWSPGESLRFGGGGPLRPLAAPTATTTYTLTAGPDGCRATSQVTVRVLPPVRIPNTFSPNGDGQDDTWQIERIGRFPANRVSILNRWGNAVFETTGYGRANEWAGLIRGQPAPVGTYYYIVRLGNGKSYAGSLTVLY